jgi:hypothetical protein
MILTGDVSTLWSRGGFVFWGGFMGSVLLCYIAIKYKKLSFTRYADVAGIAIAAGYAVGRTGCWAVGDDYGRPVGRAARVRVPERRAAVDRREHARAVRRHGIPADVPADTLIFVHPTQLYETAMGLVMFAVLWRLRSHKHAEGMALRRVLRARRRRAVRRGVLPREGRPLLRPADRGAGDRARHRDDRRGGHARATRGAAGRARASTRRRDSG